MTSYKGLCFPIHYHVINYSRRIKRAEHVVHQEKRRMQTGFWWGRVREQDQCEDWGVNRRVILKCMFKEWDGGH